MSQTFADRFVADMNRALLGGDADMDGTLHPRKSTYQARGIRRHRATKEEIARRRGALYHIVQAMKPMTVRQIFYQATVRGIVEKSEAGYAKVQTDLTLMRKERLLPYSWITDHTRWLRKPESYGSIEEALNETTRFYRKALWTNVGSYVEIWLEKEALAGVVYPVTATYDVPLMVARGYPIFSFLHAAAENIAEIDAPTFIYHLGDFDPSGVNAGEKIEQTLKEMAPGAEIIFERIAVTPDQIAAWDLPTRPTKATDSRSKNFGAVSVELDAIEPGTLRDLVQGAIERHLPAHELAVLKVAEESERTQLAMFTAKFVDKLGRAQ